MNKLVIIHRPAFGYKVYHQDFPEEYVVDYDPVVAMSEWVKRHGDCIWKTPEKPDLNLAFAS